MEKFDYRWTLADAKFSKDKGKVFSCFACGGGSTMGYKLAGFDVVGCNEIDPKLIDIYKINHNPKYAFCEPIQTFKLRDDLPSELYELDILDGSPPCSNFSMAGNREKDWGKNKKFREGQAEQVLDTLFFDFIDLANKLQPKVVVAENVKGLLLGNAIDYVSRIYKEFDEAGYYCQHWLFNAADMGVPQKRERVFFVCLRKDLAKPFLISDGLFDVKPKLDLEFNYSHILFKEVMTDNNERPLSAYKTSLWELRQEGDIDLSFCCARNGENPNKFFNTKFIYQHKVCNTITAKGEICLFDAPRRLGDDEIIPISSFPNDYHFKGYNVSYICGMSVPPLMTANISREIYNQWLSQI